MDKHKLRDIPQNNRLEDVQSHKIQRKRKHCCRGKGQRDMATAYHTVWDGAQCLGRCAGTSAKVGSRSEMHPGVLGTIFTNFCTFKSVFK